MEPTLAVCLANKEQKHAIGESASKGDVRLGARHRLAPAMGTFLSQPVTEQETDELLSPNEQGLSYGVSSMQGWRSGKSSQV